MSSSNFKVESTNPMSNRRVLLGFFKTLDMVIVTFVSLCRVIDSCPSLLGPLGRMSFFSTSVMCPGLSRSSVCNLVSTSMASWEVVFGMSSIFISAAPILSLGSKVVRTGL